MSFGLLKHFKDRKTGSSENTKISHYRHVIVGQDVGAVLKLVEMKRAFPDESIRLISSRPMNKQLLIENFCFGVSQLRSEAAVTEIYKKHFNARILPQQKDALFYKDGKFHEFSGRAKPMELQAGESFFTERGYRVDIQSLFTAEDWSNLDAILIAHQEVRIFSSIEKKSPSDLVEKNEWSLTFKDFSTVTCENLYLSTSPKKFLSYLAAKEELTPELIDVCSSANIQAAISVSWLLNKEIYPEERTLFIPQSMTHEWGHFIVEFEPYSYEKQQQLCHALFIIHEEDPQTEDVASKIKLMKRVLDRVFPEIENSISKEYIRFDEDMFISGVKDESIEQLGFDYPTLKFLGQMSPMKSSQVQEKFLARVLLN